MTVVHISICKLTESKSNLRDRDSRYISRKLPG